MPEVTIEIGGRAFEVACQEGEESYLQAAARLLDEEAGVLTAQVGRVPEARMLLMAGLMLADKTAGLEEQLARLQQDGSAVLAELDALRAKPAPAPEKVEVPVIPSSVVETMAELTARAEALAQKVDDKLAG